MAASRPDRKLNFADERERDLFNIALLGEDVIHFFQTDPVGKMLHHRAKLEIQQAEVDALAVDVDGWRGWLFAQRKLRRIRQRAEVARLFIRWLGDAIIEGQNASRELEDDHETLST